MKKLVTLLLTMIMVFSLAACSKGDDAGGLSRDDKTTDSSQQQTQDTSHTNEEDFSEPSVEASISESDEAKISVDQEDSSGMTEFLTTRTGRFYSRFTDKMYMEYEMEVEGQKMTVISATNGDRIYSETKIGGTSAGVSIMEGQDMYTIDHAGKMVIKMSLQADMQTIAGAVLEESDIDMGDYKTGTREIEGKTYDTEEWVVEGAASIMCFDGSDLAYMIGSFGGEEVMMKIIEVSDKVDDSLFEIPDGYTLMEM